MKKYKLYLSHPITNLSGEEVFGYYDDLKKYFSEIGYKVFHPLVSKGNLRNEKCLKGTGYNATDNPMATDHAIFRRDVFMVKQSDIVLVDLSDTTRVSIGCSCEISIASVLGKHTILIMQKDNIHSHAFIKESADIIFVTLNEAKKYLKAFVNQSFE